MYTILPRSGMRSAARPRISRHAGLSSGTTCGVSGNTRCRSIRPMSAGERNRAGVNVRGGRLVECDFGLAVHAPELDGTEVGTITPRRFLELVGVGVSGKYPRHAGFERVDLCKMLRAGRGTGKDCDLHCSRHLQFSAMPGTGRHGHEPVRQRTPPALSQKNARLKAVEMAAGPCRNR